MMRLTFLFLIVLLGGCMSPSSPPLKDIHQRAVDLLAPLLDSGYIQTKFIIVEEVAFNDSNRIFLVIASDSPATDTGGLPTLLINYKGSYISFVYEDNSMPEMSRTELFEQGYVPDSNFRVNEHLTTEGIWALALRRYENKQVLIKEREDRSSFNFDYPELWPFLSGSYSTDRPLGIVIGGHNIVVDKAFASQVDSLCLDSLKTYIDRFIGYFYMVNTTDTSVTISKNEVKNKDFAVVNGKDTLELIVCNTLPITIEPNGYEILGFNSKSPHNFLKKLPDKDIWMSMYRLFSDSTFCFLKVNGCDTNYRTLHNDSKTFSTMDTLTKYEFPYTRFLGRDFYNTNVYDMDKREYNFWGWPWP